MTMIRIVVKGKGDLRSIVGWCGVSLMSTSTDPLMLYDSLIGQSVRNKCYSRSVCTAGLEMTQFPGSL